HSLNKLITLNIMSLHDRIFFRVSSARLAEDRCKNLVDLSDVMQERGNSYTLDLFILQPDRFRDQFRIPRHATRVTRRIRIPRFDSHYHQLQEFLIGLLQLPVGLVELPETYYGKDKCDRT